jgi:hypothetical protein
MEKYKYKINGTIRKEGKRRDEVRRAWCMHG